MGGPCEPVLLHYGGAVAHPHARIEIADVFGFSRSCPYLPPYYQRGRVVVDARGELRRNEEPAAASSKAVFMGPTRMTDVPPRYELQRQYAQRAHDQLGQFQQSVNEAAIKGGDAALRAALLINGGAAVSVLAFIGGLPAQDRIKLDQLKGLAGSLMLVAAVVAMGFAYFTNYTVAAEAKSHERQWEYPYVKPGKNTPKLRKS
jgi:hypothetical protein